MASSMTLQEAADILGVPIDSDKKTVDAAARTLIRKWHPDKWRNASPEEQKRASNQFMRITKAQKILKNPESAGADDVAQHNPTNMPGSGDMSYPNAATSGFATPSDPRTTGVNPFEMDVPNQRQRYNTATSFEDAFGQLPDPMETSLSEMFASEVTGRYHQRADAIRLTLSLISSVIMFAISFYLFFTTIVGNMNAMVAEGTVGEKLSTLFPVAGGEPTVITFLILCLVAALKAVMYDGLISYRIAERLQAVTPITLLGIESIVLGVIGLILSGKWPVPRMMYGILMLVGIVAVVIQAILRLTRHAPA